MDLTEFANLSLADLTAEIERMGKTFTLTAAPAPPLAGNPPSRAVVSTLLENVA